MRFVIHFISNLLISPVARATIAAGDSIVKLPYVSYQGVVDDTLGITSYRGLRYAAPPTGSLRWQPPVPIEEISMPISTAPGIIEATEYGPMCPQGLPLWYLSAPFLLQVAGGTVGALPPLSQSEDCLLLDVIVPNRPRSSKLPVIVQIHGGGYTLGYSGLYAGNNFVAESNGSVIYVEIQYRLGALGFLSSQELNRNGTANAGLLDQRLALQWVQRYISYFGGDASKVTIWGGSAGGSSVVAQLMLYGGERYPPFRAGIAEYPWMQPFHRDTTLEAQYKTFLNVTGCPDLLCLRASSTDTIIKAASSIMSVGYLLGEYGFGDFWFGPTVDGTIIKGLPSQEIPSGRFSRVPLLTDHEEFEGVLFSNEAIHFENQVQPDLQDLWPTAPPLFFDRLFSLYPASAFSGSYFMRPFFAEILPLAPTLTLNSPFFQRQSIFGDAIVNCPTQLVASSYLIVGQPIWKLKFGYGIAVHSSTQPYLLSASSAVENPKLAAIMKYYFLSFVVSLNPNALAAIPKPSWPQYGTNSTVLDIDASGHISFKTDEDSSARCRFLHSQGNILRN